MPNSIVDHDNAYAFALKHASDIAAAAGQFPTISTASFDDLSSTSFSSGREDFLLALVSSSMSGGSAAQTTNQKRALAILEACGVQPEVLDAADSANALVRDELFEMSGIRGNFPQFFLVQGDRTSFFADFAELEHMNEEGTLVEWLGMELPMVSVKSNNNNPSITSTNHASDSPLRENNNPSTDHDRPISDQDHYSMKDQGNADGMEYNDREEYAATSTTEDLFNVAAVTKMLNSTDTTNTVPNKQVQHQHQHQQQQQQQHYDENNYNINNNNMIPSIPEASTTQEEEWCDPLLLERYEDEIQALEGYLQGREEPDGEEQQEQQQQQQQNNIQDMTTSARSEENNNEENDNDDDGIYSDTCIYEVPTLHSMQSLISISSHDEDDPCETAVTPTRRKQNNQYSHKHNKPVSSLSSVATTATITPTSSSSPSRSPDNHRRYDNNSSPLRPLSYNNNTNNDNKDIISCNVSMETVSTRSETEQLLRDEVEKLRRKCKELASERYIMEGQLKEARQQQHNNEERTSLSRSNDNVNVNVNDNVNDIGVGAVVHKSQLQQTMRCGYCMKAFKSDPLCLNAPIASQACGHSICRQCCHQRLSSSRKAVPRRRRDDITMNSSPSIAASERLRSTISSDLFMCGMGDMNQLVYSVSFDELQHQQQQQQHEHENAKCESCPICRAPKAFRHGKLHVNESLCVVLKLLATART